MKIGLFASGTVGIQIAKFLGDQGEAPACLAIDARDTCGLNADIIAAASLPNPNRVFLSDSLYEPETLARLKELKPDLIVLAWWPYILKREIIEIPRLGSLNFHPSLLPYNRGKHYNFWALVEGAPFGVTLHWVDVAVDCGDIAFQSPIQVTWEDTGATLYHKAQEEIVHLFMKRFAEIKAGRIPRIPQDLSRGSFHRAHELEQASRIELDKNYNARDLLNVLRARTFPPHPAAWFTEGDTRYEVRVEIKKAEKTNQV